MVLARPGTGVDAVRFLPSALNVKVTKLKQARVSGGSNYDSLEGCQMPRRLIRDAHEWIHEITCVCIYIYI